jgi:N-acetylglucosaminyl-diphospho-decaprenol L-rhamnosyltransferase
VTERPWRRKETSAVMCGRIDSAMNLDICVVCYESEATLPALVSSLAKHLPPGFRILLWSNSLREKLTPVADSLAIEFALTVTVLGDGSNLGFGEGCNRLAQSSDREWLLFLNPDAAVRSWPNEWCLPEGALVGPVVYLPDGSQQETFGRDRTLAYEIRQRLLRRKVHPGIPSVMVNVDFVSGAAILVRREDFLAMKGFDESFFMYYEDIDLGRRWRRSGRPVVIEPRWTVMHIGGASSQARPLTALIRSQRSAEQFHEKWTGTRLPFLAISLVEAFMKLCISLPLGRVGQVDRATQLKFFRQLLRPEPGEHK